VKEIRLVKRGMNWWCEDHRSIALGLCHGALVRQVYLLRSAKTIFITFSKNRRDGSFYLQDEEHPIRSLPQTYVYSPMQIKLRRAVRAGYKYARIEYEE